jgi:dienelactone hydrolase
VGAAIFAFAIVVLTVIVAGAFVLRSLSELPTPTGPFSVGTASFALNRPIEPGERSPGQFIVQLWYPAQPSPDRAPYGTDVDGIKGWIYNRLIHTHSARDAAPVLRRSAIILYVPGWSDKRFENTALAEELASHGYAVAAFDGVRRDSPALDRLAGGFDMGSAQGYEASIELAQRRLPYEAQRASRVLDFLTELDAGDAPGPFAGRFDLGRIGLLGYSFGGAVAFETCRRDRRFSAVMNLGGALLGAGNGYKGEFPYFFVRNSLPTPEDLASNDPWLRYRSKLTLADLPDHRKVVRYGGYELEVDGTEHGSFNDAPLYAPLRRFRSGWSNPPRIVCALRRYMLAFFEQALHGTASPLLAPGTRDLPAMTLTLGDCRVSRAPLR